MKGEKTKMNKNKKLIALICAISMIFSVFAGMTVVNAEDITQGIVLEYDAENSTADKAVVVAKSVGFTEVESYTVNINLPDGATLTPTKQLIAGGATGTNGYSAATDTAVAVTDGVLVAFEIALAQPLKSDFEVSLQAKSGISLGSTKLSVERNNLPAASTTIPKYVDPNATPEPTPIATRAPKPTVDPSATTAPTKAPVTVEKGITLEYDAENSKADKAVIVAKSVGFTEVESYTVNINLPDGATLTPTKQLIAGGATGTNGYSAATDTAVAVTDGVLVAFEIALAQPLTAPFDVELQAKSGISLGSTKLSVERNNLPIAWTTIPVIGGGDEPVPSAKPVGSVTLPDVKIEVDDIPAGAEDSVYLALKVTKKDGTDAVYGTDYVATIGDKPLTKEELSNVLNGYFDLVDGVDSWADVINNLKFNVFNSGTSVAAQLIQETAEGGVVIAGGEKTVGTTKPTPAPKAPTIGVTVSPSTVYVGTKVTVKATVTNPKDGGVLAVAPADESLDYVTASGIKSDVADDNKSATTTFTAALKGTNAVVLNYTYTYTDAEGAEQTVTAEKKITIKEKTDNGGGSGSSSSSSSTGSGGPIAGPSGSLTPTGGTTIGGTSFNDLGDVAWAQEAIYALASKGIINGRDEYTFDPNANITRAEYCQILIGAIGKSSEYADSSFADVPTDAWFYHAVAVASQYGIVSGYGDGNFGPYDLITRQDMALMTLRAAQVMNKNLVAATESSFTDADQISDYAQEAVYTLANAGIINGMGDGTFAPIANATRAQAAVIIYSTFVK